MQRNEKDGCVGAFDACGENEAAGLAKGAGRGDVVDFGCVETVRIILVVVAVVAVKIDADIGAVAASAAGGVAYGDNIVDDEAE